MTGIEWTDRVWNPTTGCDRVSPGCDNCYALKMAKRLKGMGSAKYQTDGDPRTSGPGFGLAIHPDALGLPLTWKKPRKVFVNSMSDLFHADVPDEFIAQVFAVMAATPRHTFQVLTKRHARMRALLNNDEWLDLFAQAYWTQGVGTYAEDGPPWPLPNVHLGVSVEDQQWADIRLPALVETPAAVRWVSAEPLLGPVDLSPWLGRIDWVVAGGESGPGARPMHPDWVRSIRDQCADAGVPFLFKQWGNWTQVPPVNMATTDRWVDLAGGVAPVGSTGLVADESVVMRNVGKKAAGRVLDGRSHDEYPLR